MSAELLSSLDKPPRSKANTIWADYIELRCLIHPDQYFSLDGAEEALHEADDYSADAEEQNQTNSNEGLDKLEAKWADCEQIIQQRAQRLGEAYPFVLANGYRGIEVSTSADSPLRQWYRFLLLSASLQYVPAHNALTSAFEKASLNTFRHLQPAGSEVHGFWPGAHHYPDDKPGRLTKLAEDLRTTPIFADNAFHEGDRGDSGIDLVAWHPLGDTRDLIPISIGQCGCSVTDWRTKPLSVTPPNLSRKLHIPNAYWSFYFMPLDMISPTGRWADGSGELPSVIVIDRTRFIGLAGQVGIPLPEEATLQVARLDEFRYR